MNANWQYLKYVVRHKFFVFKAGLQTKAPLWRLLIHDWSKFLPSEFGPYATYFNNPTMKAIRELKKIGERLLPSELEIEARATAAFDRAWLKHQHRSPHHWQHWVLQEDTPTEPTGKPKVLKMPEHFTREMVADWMGAGRAITGAWDIKPWYVRNVHNIKLHPETRAFVEDLIFGADHGLIGSSNASAGTPAGATA